MFCLAGVLLLPAWAADAPQIVATKPVVAPNPAAKATAAKPYVLRPTDVITVTVVDDARASHEYKLSLDGTIKPVYLAQSVKLAGLSAASAEDALAKAYVAEKIFAQPQIAIAVKEYTEQRVYFIGEVNHQGAVTIPPERELSLVAAFSLAGGHTRIASRNCTITRLLPDGKSTTSTLDLRAAVEDAKKDILLQDGDTISLGTSLLGNDWD